MGLIRKFQKDASGFTLVELLVAVLLLGILTAPLLHTFVTSAKTAKKSRDIGEATRAAQNLSESVEAASMQELAALTAGSAFSGATAESMDAEDYVYETDANGDYVLENGKPKQQGDPVPHLDETENASRYRLRLSGVSSGTFDAEILLDTAPYSAENLTEVTNYTAMDAVFSQPSSSTENPDFLAADAFLNETVALTGNETLYTAGYFDSLMKRTVSITVQQDGEEFVASTTYAYSYTLTYTISTLGDDGVVRQETRTAPLSAQYTYEFYSSQEPPQSLYFFFFPNYNTALTWDDEVTLQNTGDLSFSFFLIKQKAIDRTLTAFPESTLDGLETGYSALVSLKESAASSKPHASVFSNISRNISKTVHEGNLLPVTFRVFYGSNWFLPDHLLENLVDQSSQNRLYQVTIRLYAPGTDDLIYELQSSKLG